MKELQIPEIVDLASAFYGSAVLFAALDAGVFAAIEKAGGASADLPALAAATGAMRGSLSSAPRVFCSSAMSSLPFVDAIEGSHFQEKGGRGLLRC